MTVSGLTITSAVRQAGHARDNHAQSHRSPSRPIQDIKLVPQGEHFKLQFGARPKTTSDRQDHRYEKGKHRDGAYPGKTRTSMATTSREFSVSTAGLDMTPLGLFLVNVGVYALFAKLVACRD